MRKKTFAVSDIHGDYKALIEGLKVVGYDENDPSHLLISLGDAFDRGTESVEVYKYLKRLSDEGKAVILKGNHTNFLIDYLDGSNTSPFNYFNNGTENTIESFLNEKDAFYSYANSNWLCNGYYTYEVFEYFIRQARVKIKKEYPELLNWLKERPYYFETKNYIFTHASIDTEVEDWHKPHCSKYNYKDWEALLWDDGSFFGKKIKNTDKTVAIGHFGTSHLREMYGINDGQDEYSILKREDGRVIAIDGTTTLSHKVNVLVIEDEIEV